MNKYRVIEDLQGGEFGMGRDMTAKEWLECMLEWRDSDDNWGDWGDGDNKYLDTRDGCKQFWESIINEGKEQELIDYIADVWSLEFEKVKGE